ncbi:hypothetical protein ATANTOWER_030056 [Ataeniobius toweri]|uniref:Uncharacterized protein n=1 Tax=Ataeniobius toweri TaxID=208326 RepID=A0ABU7BAJ7_9TELE|nr:hypothetical protein [Ataeniobius toweri]
MGYQDTGQYSQSSQNDTNPETGRTSNLFRALDPETYGPMKTLWDPEPGQMRWQNNKVEKNQSKRLQNVPGRPRTETELYCFAAEYLTDVFLFSVITSSCLYVVLRF